MSEPRVDRTTSWRRPVVTAALAALVTACVMTTLSDAAIADGDGRNEQEAKGHFAVPPPPFSSDDIFPCSSCHDDSEVDTRKRELTDFHEEIELYHGTRERWCFDCHNPDNRDVLRLAGGELVPFTESYRLCGQCHGDKYRDWKVGVHGKRTGEWDGKKQYLLCAHCHNPHTPHFEPIAPMPPPERPSLLR